MEPQSAPEDTPCIELEHAIGYGGIPMGLHYHPNMTEYIYAAGGCVVVAAFDDPHSQTFLRGHDGTISCLIMSPTGRMLASGQPGENSDILIWNFESKSLMYKFSEHDYGIAAMAFSHDEAMLATVGVPEDGKMYIWDMSTGNIVSTQQKLVTGVSAIAWGGMHRDIKRRDTSNYLFATAGRQMINFWVLNPSTGELTGSKTESSAHLVRDYTCIQFSPDRELVYAGTSSGEFAVVSVKGYRVITCISACTCGVHAVAPFHQGVLIGGGDGGVYYYDSNHVDQSFAQLEGAVSALSLSADTTEVIAGTSSGFIYRLQLDLATTTIPSLLLCENHTVGVVRVAFATASDRFATISLDGTIRIWDASDYSVLTKCTIQCGGIPTALQYSPDILLSGWTDGCIRCHHADTGQFLWTIDNAHTGGVTAITLSHNERFIVTGGAAGDVRVWDLRKRDLVSHLKEHSMCVTDLALFEDDIHALSCSRDRSFLCWDLRQERRISSHTQRMGGINAISLSQDQTQLVTVGQEKKISFWDLRVESPVRQIHKAHADEATCLAIGHKVKVIATGGTDQMVKLWDYDSGECLVNGVGHSGTVNSVAFSPDDRQLVSVGEDGNIFVWNMYT